MEHPIHLHGQRFLVLRAMACGTSNLVWKDTAIIPAGETVDLLVEMSNPGTWMMHCHIAEHLGSGMMAVFTVVPRVSSVVIPNAVRDLVPNSGQRSRSLARSG